MTPADTLRAARALIERPSIVRSIFHVCKTTECAMAAFDAFATAISDDTDPDDWQAAHTHAEVLAAFDRAIEIAERK